MAAQQQQLFCRRPSVGSAGGSAGDREEDRYGSNRRSGPRGSKSTKLNRSVRIKRWLQAKAASDIGWVEDEVTGKIAGEVSLVNSDVPRETILNQREAARVQRKTILDPQAVRDPTSFRKVRNRKLSTAAKYRRRQWLEPSPTSSISSESSGCNDLTFEEELRDNLEFSDDIEDIKEIRERRMNALKDKLNSKGQSYELIDLLSAKKEEELLNMIRSRHTRVVLDICLLWSCLQDDCRLIAQFLALGANPSAADAEGFNAMHLAAENSSSDSIKVLIAAEAGIIGPLTWDNKKEFTPLMLSARAGNVSTTSALIAAGADVNAGLNSKNKVALHYAVRSESFECVSQLLAAAAVPNPLTLYSETPLHIAVGEGYYAIVKILLGAGADVRASRGTARMASIHIAAHEGHASIVRLLLDAGADHKQRNARGQTALHLAARSQSADTVLELLKDGANPNARDGDGKSPLHAGIFKGSRCFECLKVLVEANADPNIADSSGYTPLHLAALQESSYCVQMFLKHGADVSARTRGGLSAFNIILRKTPVGLSYLQEILDASITHDDRDQHHDLEALTQLDFRIFRGAKGREPECRLLTCFINEGQRMLLKHPICESFLYLKWQQVRSFFIMNLIFYLLLVLSLTSFILLTFPGSAFCEFFVTKTSNPFAASFRSYKFRNFSERTETVQESKVTIKCKNFLLDSVGNVTYPGEIELPCIILNLKVADIKVKKNDSNLKSDTDSTEPCSHTQNYEITKQFLIYLVAILLFILTIKELIQFLDTPTTYITTLDNLLVWPIIIFTILIIVVGAQRNIRSPWEHHVAAVLLLISWVELMLLIGRFPLFGLYVHMFAQVTRNFGKFLFTYMCLISAFSLSFGVLFHNHDPFKYFLFRLLKTLVMMTGEMEYDDFFFDGEEILYPGTSHIILAMFLIFGTIILMNLLVGLAVNDIQGLQQSAGLERLVRQTQVIASLELIIFSRWLSITTPASLLQIIRNRVLLLPSVYRGILTLASKTVKGYKLPSELVESIQKVAHLRDHGSRRKTAFANFRSMSQAAHYGGGVEAETARGIEAVHCGLEILVKECDDRKNEAKELKQSVMTIMYQLQQLKTHDRSKLKEGI